MWQALALNGLTKKIVLFAISKFFTDKRISKMVIGLISLERDLVAYLAPRTTTKIDDRVVIQFDEIIKDLKSKIN